MAVGKSKQCGFGFSDVEGFPKSIVKTQEMKREREIQKFIRSHRISKVNSEMVNLDFCAI